MVKETPVQKFQRLQHEMRELSEEVEELKVLMSGCVCVRLCVGMRVCVGGCVGVGVFVSVGVFGLSLDCIVFIQPNCSGNHKRV